jgi:hypothetical protein
MSIGLYLISPDQQLIPFVAVIIPYTWRPVAADIVQLQESQYLAAYCKN